MPVTMNATAANPMPIHKYASSGNLPTQGQASYAEAPQRAKMYKLFAACLLSVMVFFTSTSLKAQTADIDYLPSNQNYDASIPLPADVLGYPVGTWHVRHDQLVQYMRALAAASPRVSLTETGRTHEQRPLLLLTITAEQNSDKVDQWRSDHLQRIASGSAAPSSAPLFLYMGYSVHGNEPSGANASMLVAYHLAASQSEEVKNLLNNNVVLLDPSLNPDGLSRFAQWANMHRGQTLVADSTHREHREHWPSGRTNHYWFDLNRDWLLLTHPESKARITQFHQWRPHVLTDFHEMGTDSTYFFQPGITSRKNPWTPDENVTLTAALGDFHAKALDDTDQLYFTQEAFDDFYYGKGSTYPDAHGSIGILFEQASSRGHLQESINGELSFPETIQNQVTTSLSTFAGSMANKSAILAYQAQFYKDTKKLIGDDKSAGYIISGGKDPARLARAKFIFSQHQIKFSELSKDVRINDVDYRAGQSLYVELEQAQYRLIKSLFSERQRFLDNTFYDVSNWNLPLAFNFDYSAVSNSQQRKLSLSQQSAQDANTKEIKAGAYAYAFEWFDYQAPRMLQDLLEQGVQVRVAGALFSAKTLEQVNSERDFAAGTVVIPRALKQPENLHALLQAAVNSYHIDVYHITSGLTAKGIDLGSRQFSPVTLPKVLLIGGKGTSQYEVGEIWHYLDTRLGLPATLLDLSDLNGRDISAYTHLVFASGNYREVDESTQQAIREWVKKGGVLVGQKSAVKWFSKNNWIANRVLDNDDINAAFDTKGMQFGDQNALAAKKLIAGSVYQSKVDLSHPLLFGYERSTLPLFKTTNMVLKATDDPFTNVASYAEKPLMAGYTADELQGLIANTSAIVVNPIGKGAVVAFVDNIHFRGYWVGTDKLMANSLYMTPLL